MSGDVLINSLFVFMLAGFVGFQVIKRVSPLLHTPLMSLTNALDAIAVVGAILLAGRHDTKTTPEQIGLLRDRVRSHGRLVIFESAGHLGYLQSDLGRYRRCLLDFVREATRDHALSR